MVITHEQAIKAVNMIESIVSQTFPEGQRHEATEIRLHPDFGLQMKKLIEEIKANE